MPFNIAAHAPLSGTAVYRDFAFLPPSSPEWSLSNLQCLLCATCAVGEGGGFGSDARG